MRKPFDLEAAKRGEPILCDGEPCKFIAHVPEADFVWRVVVLRKEGYIETYTEAGFNCRSSRKPSLTMAPKPKVKREGWVNVYKSSATGYRAADVSHAYRTRQEAGEGMANNPDFLATVRVEWEEEA